MFYQYIFYTFSGWNTAYDGSGIQYSDLTALNAVGADSGVSVLTLYANWIVEVTFDANGGVLAGGTTDDEKALSGQSIEAISFNLNQIASTGLTGQKTYSVFITWNTRPDGTGTNIEDYGTLIGPETFYAIYYQNEFWYTGDYQVFEAPFSGTYRLEAWGSRGGYGNTLTTAVGFGGYTAGEIHLEAGTILYVYVGQMGQNLTQKEISYNGGAASPVGLNEGHRGGGGGGATDFRLIPGEWDNISSLRSRILVAGGGGGANSICSRQNTAGHGGGLVGATSKNIGYSDGVGTWENLYQYYSASGGTQTSGGKGTASKHNIVASGSFGAGNVASTCCGGGGGGWYGGGSAYVCGGGGGSSYPIGFEGCDTTWADFQRNLVGYDLTFTNGILEQGVWNDNGKALVTLISLD